MGRGLQCYVKKTMTEKVTTKKKPPLKIIRENVSKFNFKKIEYKKKGKYNKEWIPNRNLSSLKWDTKKEHPLKVR